MSKKYLLLIVVLLGFAVFVTGCGGGRDLPKASSRIVGHWAYFGEGETDPTIEVYIGEANDEGVGSYIWGTYPPVFRQNPIYANYRVLSEDRNAVRIEVFGLPSLPGTRSHKITINKDGQSLMIRTNPNMEHISCVPIPSYKYQYIDSKVEP